MKRRSERRVSQAQRKTERAAAQLHPAGQSRYAQKEAGTIQPQSDPHRRPSWMVRAGLGREPVRVQAQPPREHFTDDVRHAAFDVGSTP